MNYWISIVSSPSSHKRLSENAETYFCMPPDCQAGDIVALYVTRRASKNPGLFGIFSIDKLDPSKDAECKTYETITRRSDCSSYVEISLLHAPKKPIGIDLLKSNPILGSSTFVKKNMLGTYFRASKSEYGAILNLLQISSK
jgi:hypothetical protein